MEQWCNDSDRGRSTYLEKQTFPVPQFLPKLPQGMAPDRTQAGVVLQTKINLHYPLSYGVPVRERYGSTLLPATREQHDQKCTQSH